MLGLTWLEIQGFCCDFFRNSSKSAEKRRDHQHKRLIENGITSRKLGGWVWKKEKGLGSTGYTHIDDSLYDPQMMRITNFFSFLTNLDGDTKAPTDDPSPPSAEFFSGRQGIRLYGDPPKRDGASRITMEDRKPKGFQPTGLDQLDRIGSRETKHWISWNGIPPF